MSQTEQAANVEVDEETGAEPYQAIGRAAVDIAAGSRIMTTWARQHTSRALRSAWGVAWAGGRTSDRFESLGVAALAGSVVLGGAGSFGMGLWLYLGPDLSFYLPLAGIASPVIWSGMALAVARTGASEEAEAAPEELPVASDNVEADAPNDHESSGEEATTEADPPDAEKAARALFRFVLAAVADAEANRVQGVHINTLLSRLQEEARNFEAWEVSDLRAWCDSAGLPVTKTKVGSAGPTWGVRVDEVTKRLGRPLGEALADLDTTPPERPREQPGDGAEEAALTPDSAPLPDGVQKPVDKARVGILASSSPGVAG